MKKLIALLLALTMMMCLVACGNDEETGIGDKAGLITPEDGPGTVVEVSGETYDAGNVKGLVPDGWKAYPVMDIWSDDPNATDPDQFNIVLGGETDLDLLTKASMQIVHYQPESMMTPSPEFYDGAVTIEPIVAGDLTWEGFSAKDFMDNPMTIIWTTNAAGHQFQVTLFTKNGDSEYSLTDAAVVAILASITNSK